MGEPELVQLTSGSEWDLAPDWSPDGSKIAFERGRESINGIYVIGSGGSGLRRPVDGAGKHPARAPGGRTLAYARRGDIWVVPARGGPPRNVTRTRSPGKDEQDPAWQAVR